MEVKNTNNFIIIASEGKTKSNINDSAVAVQERKNEDGKPGKVEKNMAGKGNAVKVAEHFIREGFDPEKIIINGTPSSDVLELNKNKLKEIKRAEFQVGLLGYQKIGKFSDEEVEKMNKEKILPEGQYIVFTPKINSYINGMFAGTTNAKAAVIKASDKKLKAFDRNNLKYTNKLPDQYEIVNDGGKTYLKEKNTDIKEAKRDYKKQIAAGLSILAGFITTAAVIVKFASRK